MVIFKLKYNDGNEKISTQNKIDEDGTKIEWYIEKMCQFLIALGFSKSTIQNYIGFDGELFTIENWNEGLEEEIK